MSWSFNAIGTPENLAKAIDADAAGYTGQSKVEFDEAAPHLKGLLAMNVNKSYPTVLHLEASGHATLTNGETTYSVCSVSLKSCATKIVT